MDSSVVRGHQHAAGARIQVRGRRVLAGQKAGRRGRGDGRESLGRSRSGLFIKIHLAVCIKIQWHASGSLKTWACTNPPFCAPRSPVRRRWLRS